MPNDCRLNGRLVTWSNSAVSVRLNWPPSPGAAPRVTVAEAGRYLAGSVGTAGVGLGDNTRYTLMVD